jgi:hypothetical protein
MAFIEGEKMISIRNLASNLAIAILGLLILLGLAFEVFFALYLSAVLEHSYVEFRGSRMILVLMVLVVIVCTQIVLVQICILLRRISSDRLLQPSSFQTVSILIVSFFAVAGASTALLLWLVVMQAQPGSMFVMLVVLICISMAAGLVIFSLKDVMRVAVKSKDELESVI